MTLSRWRPGPELLAATIGAALIGAQYIAGKAARDALFLAAFDPSMLPRMIIGTSLFSIVLVLASSKFLSRVSPGTWVPIAFAASAALFFAEWAMTGTGPGVAASLLYLQVSGIGPMLGSGFWLIASERFDPRTAKKNFGTIAGAGTLGGLLGGLIAARITAATSIETMLPILAVGNGVCAWQVWRMARGHHAQVGPAATGRNGPQAGDAASGVRLLANTPYLRNLAFLVLLGTIAAVMIDYLFKVQVKDTFGRGPALGSFFSIYYAAVSLLTFGVQTLMSKTALQRFGLAVCASSPATVLAGGGVLALVAPGFPTLLLTRSAEAVTRGSLYRAGYELFYTPIAPKDKRAVKAVVDVGIDRSGDILGATMVQLLLWLPATQQPGALVGLSIICSVLALVAARRLTSGYVQTLEQSLRNRGTEIELSKIEDRVTRTVILKTISVTAAPAAADGSAVVGDVDTIVALRAADDQGAVRILRREAELSPALVPHIIPLLARDNVAPAAIRALQSTAESNIGAITDALVNPNQEFVIRRRLPRVFEKCTSQRALDGLLLGLDDLRFEVRFRTARTAASLLRRNRSLTVDTERILAIVRREISVSRSVWEGRQLVDGNADDADGPTSVEALINERASKSLGHVFTLLSLTLPAEPLRIAYACLHATDKGLRGTALEYIDAVLPSEIRDSIWPFLEGQPTPPAQVRPREIVTAELLKAHQSILIHSIGSAASPSSPASSRSDVIRPK